MRKATDQKAIRDIRRSVWPLARCIFTRFVFWGRVVGRWILQVRGKCAMDPKRTLQLFASLDSIYTLFHSFSPHTPLISIFTHLAGLFLVFSTMEQNVAFLPIHLHHKHWQSCAWAQEEAAAIDSKEQQLITKSSNWEQQVQEQEPKAVIRIEFRAIFLRDYFSLFNPSLSPPRYKVLHTIVLLTSFFLLFLSTEMWAPCQRKKPPFSILEQQITTKQAKEGGVAKKTLKSCNHLDCLAPLLVSSLS